MAHFLIFRDHSGPRPHLRPAPAHSPVCLSTPHPCSLSLVLYHMLCPSQASAVLFLPITLPALTNLYSNMIPEYAYDFDAYLKYVWILPT